ncbi:hypothetical protein BDM02DRAFT_3109836 [Thelephora ganbajun]|uniref:Uncharacterized protein n=1 Tax=Thelephora ganbajun TaxID=370292 RepID=A0ACB6ZR98_THEGA|nr:hypothetical protein BDM02DRAFT_3109836 [Thelephora ganbajun]
MFNVEQKRRQISNRSTAVPMDFEFTNRASPNIKPAWVADDSFHAPQKRNYDEASPQPSLFPPQDTASERSFIPTSEPYLFPAAGPHTPFPPHWQPPPPHVKNPEIFDVDMSEVSPNIFKAQQQVRDDSPSKPEEESRVVALSGIRRMSRSRYRNAALKRRDVDADDADEESVNSEDEEQSDRESRVIKPAKPMTTNNHYTLNLTPSALTVKPDLPYTLSGYLQVFFNTSLCVVFLWLLLQFILTVQRDVQQRILEHSMDIVQEIKACSVLYKNNFCEGNIVPHMFQPCGEWETCMNRDPSKIGRARIGAQLLAEIVNAFVENISWKTFFFSVVSLAIFTLFINSLFTFYRSKHYHAPHSAPVPIPQPQYVMPPQTPRRGKPGSKWKPGDDGNDIGTLTGRRQMDDGTITKIKGN